MIWIIILILALFFLMPLIKHKHLGKKEVMKKSIEEEEDTLKENSETPYDFVLSDNGDKKDKERAEKIESLFTDENYDKTPDNMPYEMPLDALNIFGDESQRTTSDISQNLPETMHDNEAYALDSSAEKKNKKISGKEMMIYSEILKTKF